VSTQDLIDQWLYDWSKSIKADMYDLLFNNNKKERPMSFDKTKLFVQNPYYNNEHFATLDEAVAEAKRKAAKDFVDVPVYQAVQLVKAPIPGDINVESLNTAS